MYVRDIVGVWKSSYVTEVDGKLLCQQSKVKGQKFILNLDHPPMCCHLQTFHTVCFVCRLHLNGLSVFGFYLLGHLLDWSLQRSGWLLLHIQKMLFCKVLGVGAQRVWVGSRFEELPA